MAVVNFDRRTFEKEIGKLTDEMQEKIALFGTPVEEVTAEEVQIEVFPNRPDLLSYHNFRRSFLAFLGKKTGLKKYKVNRPEKNFKVIIDSSVKSVRPYTVCAVIKGLKLNDQKIKEIIEMQEKLHSTIGRRRKKLAIGIYPLDKIEFPLNYRALEPDKIKFIPLESEREMSGLQILQRHPMGKNYSHLLAGKSKFPVFIDAKKDILSLPPIINSDSTGRVTIKTKDLFVECSGFDFQTLKYCLNIIVSCMAEMGGKIYQVELKGAPEKLNPVLDSYSVKISLENCNKLLGLELSEKDLKYLLEKMGHNYNPKTSEVEVACWRTDILHEVDLIEDVAISYGYDKLIPEIPEISTIGSSDPREIIKKKISDIISGLGFLEISNYHLSNKSDQFDKMGFLDRQEKDFVSLESSKTEYNILRKDLSHYLMKIFSENIDSEYPQKIFEIGRVFELQNQEIIERDKLSLGISPGNFTEVKQVLEYLFRMIDVSLEFRETDKSLPYFIQGRVAEVLFYGKSVGFVGEIHPRILKNWKIKMPVALLEIDLEDIFNQLK